MRLRGDTILITGGGTGIGRGLAEDLHARGNKVIIAGRRRHVLDRVVRANPGIEAVDLDLTDQASIERAARSVLERHPELNILINNAGVMRHDNAGGPLDRAGIASQVQTNFTGPILLSNALIEHLKSRDQASIIYNTATFALAPLPFAAIYSATKAALHSFAQSQRLMLNGTNVTVHEIVPDLVATSLLGAPDPRAMSVDAFVDKVIEALGVGEEAIRPAEAPDAEAVDDRPVNGSLRLVSNVAPSRTLQHHR